MWSFKVRNNYFTAQCDFLHDSAYKFQCLAPLIKPSHRRIVNNIENVFHQSSHTCSMSDFKIHYYEVTKMYRDIDTLPGNHSMLPFVVFCSSLSESSTHLVWWQAPRFCPFGDQNQHMIGWAVTWSISQFPQHRNKNVTVQKSQRVSSLAWCKHMM